MKLISIITLLALSITNISAEIKILESSTNLSYYDHKGNKRFMHSIHIVCIDNYKYIIHGKDQKMIQMFKNHKNINFSKKPIGCKR